MTSPLRVVALVARVVSLLEEQNQLLRDLHLQMTGRPSVVPRRTQPPLQRIRTADDVFQAPPLTAAAQQARDDAVRERAASPSPPDTTSAAPPNGPSRTFPSI